MPCLAALTGRERAGESSMLLVLPLGGCEILGKMTRVIFLRCRCVRGPPNPPLTASWRGSRCTLTRNFRPQGLEAACSPCKAGAEMQRQDHGAREDRQGRGTPGRSARMQGRVRAECPHYVFSRAVCLGSGRCDSETMTFRGPGVAPRRRPGCSPSGGGALEIPGGARQVRGGDRTRHGEAQAQRWPRRLVELDRGARAQNCWGAWVP